MDNIHKRIYFQFNNSMGKSNKLYKCNQCGLEFNKVTELRLHNNACHPDKTSVNSVNDYPERECEFCHRILRTRLRTFTSHVNHCECNPNRKVWVGHGITDEVKKKISESMKIAHAEGRAHNIGECIWNGVNSYPEGWMTTVIENEFIDKDYVRNLQVGKYKLDFAWPKKMRYIELGILISEFLFICDNSSVA